MIEQDGEWTCYVKRGHTESFLSTPEGIRKMENAFRFGSKEPEIRPNIKESLAMYGRIFGPTPSFWQRVKSFFTGALG